jgi:hypothetical protein
MGALLLALVALPSRPVFSQTGGIPMHAGVSPPFAALGERVTYRGWIAVDHVASVQWNTPRTDDAFTWGELRSGRAPMARRVPGGPWPADSVWVEIPLQVFALGEITIPGVEFQWQARGSAPRTGHLPVVQLGVPPRVAANDSAADLRPPRGPIAAPWWERVPWVWVVASVLVLTAVFMLVDRLRRRRPAAVPVKAPSVVKRRDPAAEALSDLAALKRMMLLDQGKFDEHALRLSRILRRFLEATTGTMRPGDSTTELIRRLESGRHAPEDVRRLAQLLRRWDGIKFARLPSDVEEGQRCEEAVRELVLRSVKQAGAEVA